jgi:hypothetical protein
MMSAFYEKVSLSLSIKDVANRDHGTTASKTFPANPLSLTTIELLIHLQITERAASAQRGLARTTNAQRVFFDAQNNDS